MKPDPITKQILRAARSRVDEARRRAGKGRLMIGLFAFGGHGDLMRLLTFAAAVRKLYPKREAHITLICKYVAPTYEDASTPAVGKDGWAVNDEIVQMIAHQPAFFIDHVLQMHLVRWEWAVKALRPKFDLFWEVQYVAQLSLSGNRRCVTERERRLKATCDERLKPYKAVFDGFAESNPAYNVMGKTQFETLADSTGLDVRESDLRIEVERFADKGWRFGGRLWTPVVPEPTRPYVVWHNGAGGRAVTKCLPMGLLRAGVRIVREAGLDVLQVGRKDKERAIPGAFNFLGFPICDTAMLLAHPLCRGHFDIEGGIRYLARAVGRSSAVFYGPTPDTLFGWTDALAINRRVCEPCWWSCPRWDERCRLGHRWCLNMPQTTDEMERAVSGALAWFGRSGAAAVPVGQPTPVPPVAARQAAAAAPDTH